MYQSEFKIAQIKAKNEKTNAKITWAVALPLIVWCGYLIIKAFN